MQLNDLRELVFNEIGLFQGQDVLSDDKLIQSWNQAVMYWLQYKKPLVGRTHISFTVDETLSYEFTDKIPDKILVLYKFPKHSVVPCWLYWYAKPVIHLKDTLTPGNYAVSYQASMRYEDLLPSEIPPPLLWLICAYVKKKVGQFLKFSNYDDRPFDIDGEAWFREGEAQAAEWQKFIMVNRDEWASTISNFNTDFAYTPIDL